MSVSFRAAYTTHGVENYYNLVANTYKNPHEPGVIKCLRSLLESIVPVAPLPAYRLLDLAAGSGEATVAAQKWFTQRRPLLAPLLRVSACDPYTHELYTARTGLPCGRQAFRDIQVDGYVVEEGRLFDVAVCSFALHLCPASEVWGLLYTLSRLARWLVVLAPHKRPEVGTEMGWERVGKEVVIERTRGRLYRSLNFEDVVEGVGVGKGKGVETPGEVQEGGSGETAGDSGESAKQNAGEGVAEKAADLSPIKAETDV